MHLNVKTNELKHYYEHPETIGDDVNAYFGSGHYFIVYNYALNTLFSLESPDWVKTNITMIHGKNQSTQIRQIGDVLLSIDIYGNHVIYKDLDNQLKAFSPQSARKPGHYLQKPAQTHRLPR